MSDSNSTLNQFLTEDAATEVQRLLDLLADDSPEAENKIAAILAAEEESEEVAA